MEEIQSPGASQNQVATLPQSPSVQPATPPGRGLRVAGGVAGLVGALLVIIACAVPYLHTADASPSIFNPGYPGGIWFAVEPIAAVLISITAGVVIMAASQRNLQMAAAAILLATGVQTVLSFVGYAGLDLSISDRSAAPGSAIGILGGLCLTTGGLLALVGAGWLDQPPGP